MAATTNLLEEHHKLAEAWLEAERQRVEALEAILLEYGQQCIMDYPDNLFKGYEEALVTAVKANRDYVQWLARQGIRSR